MDEANIGVIGLGTMGANLALNFADNGYGVAVFDRTTARTHDFVAPAGDISEKLTTCDGLAALADALDLPPESAQSNFGKAFCTAPFGVFRAVMAVLFIAAAGAQ